jgi:hypothetical protein
MFVARLDDAQVERTGGKTRYAATQSDSFVRVTLLSYSSALEASTKLLVALHGAASTRYA